MPVLVSPQWLAQRLASSDIVVLDATLPPVGVVPKVDTHARYLQQHIPGAVFFDIDQLSDATSGLPHTLPSPESFARSMEALGISSSAILVVYEQGDIFSAPRARWMLRTMGAPTVYLLDGGLQAWLSEGLPVESGPMQKLRATFTPNFHPESVKNFAALQNTLAAHGQVLDARSAGRFSGALPEPRPGLSSGHMPGAISVPYTDLTAGAAMKPPAELAEIFATKGIDLRQPITTTCGSGVTAAVISLALELAGTTSTALYDGSWAEYAQHPGAVILKDPKA